MAIFKISQEVWRNMTEGLKDIYLSRYKVVVFWTVRIDNRMEERTRDVN